MKTIIILNSKGGVGKSNLTRHLAVAAEQDKANSVALCDTDPQGSLADWWNAREAQTPQLAKIALCDFKKKHRLIEEKFDYLFIDTAAADAEPYVGVLELSDLIIIPVQPSPDDIRSLNRLTLPVIKSSGKPFIFVISKARLGTELLVSTMAALSEHGSVCSTIIVQREGYAKVAFSGSTLLEEEPNGKGAQEIKELWKYIKLRIDEKDNSSKKKDILDV